MPISYFPPLVSNLDWGKLTGEISTQSDLAQALAQKANLNHTHELFTLIEKSTAQAIDSTVYTEISDLHFAIIADKYYIIELMLYIYKSVNTFANDLRLRCESDVVIEFISGYFVNEANLKSILSDNLFTTTEYTGFESINDTSLGRHLSLKSRFKANVDGQFCLKAALGSAGDDIEIGKGSFLKMTVEN